MSSHFRIRLLGLFFFATSTAYGQEANQVPQVREWQDASGKYIVKASYVNADEDLVVLEAADKLIVVQQNELSEGDQEYVQSRLAAARKEDSESERKRDDLNQEANAPKNSKRKDKSDSKWTLRDGEVVRGSLVGFASQDYVVNRERGKVYVNGKELERLPPAYGKIVPDGVATQDKVKITNASELEEHLADRGGGPLTYRVEGVQVVLETGDTMTIPVTLLSKAEKEDVLPGFRRWKAAQEKEVDDKDRAANSKVERLLLEAHGRDPARRLLRQQRQLQFLQLSLLSSDVGATNLWQVALHSGRPYTHPYVVMVPAENSLIAQRRALVNHPGWKAVGVRQLDR